MLRIRVFRILLPVLLVGIVVLLVWAIQPPLKPTNPLEANEVPIKEGEDLPINKIYVCAICGNTVLHDAPDKCPVCGAPKDRFDEVS